MTQDNIGRKRRVWPWLIGIALVVLAVMAWASWDRPLLEQGDVGLITTQDDPSPAAAPSDAQRAAAAVPADVAAFVTFAAAEPADVGGSHAYVSTGIDRLATALNEVAPPEAARDESLATQLQAFREKADRVQQSRDSLQHANMVRDVFTSAADIMATLQETRSRDDAALRDAIAGVRQAAAAVDADTPLLEQTDRVTQYFDRAADALRLMANAPRGDM